MVVVPARGKVASHRVCFGDPTGHVVVPARGKVASANMHNSAKLILGIYCIIAHSLPLYKRKNAHNPEFCSFFSAFPVRTPYIFCGFPSLAAMFAHTAHRILYEAFLKKIAKNSA